MSQTYKWSRGGWMKMAFVYIGQCCADIVYDSDAGLAGQPMLRLECRFFPKSGPGKTEISTKVEGIYGATAVVNEWLKRRKIDAVVEVNTDE